MKSGGTDDRSMNNDKKWPKCPVKHVSRSDRKSYRRIAFQSSLPFLRMTLGSVSVGVRTEKAFFRPVSSCNSPLATSSL